MQYNLTNDFTPISETSGIFYARRGQPVEIVTGGATEQHTGFILKDDSPMYVSGESICARAVYKSAVLNVSPASGGGCGGGGGEGDEIVTEDEMAGIYSDTEDAGAGSGSSSGDGPGLDDF